MVSSLWVYPWDVLDDPGAAEEIASLGLGHVSLAAVYHTTRMLLPHNPRRHVVSTGRAAAYFEPDPQRYRGLRLRPQTAGWVGAADSFGAALSELREAGLEVNAWTVVLHNSDLGSRNPDLVVENAFGDRYEYALCPAQGEVRRYAAALVGDLAARYPVHALELEACGYMGWEHLSHHEKFGLRLDLMHRFLLSACFCPSCLTALSEQGCDHRRLRRRVVECLQSFFLGGSPGADDPDEVGSRLRTFLGEESLELLRAARDRVTLELLDAIRSQLPSPRPRLILSAGSSPYETGACVGLSGPALAEAADAALIALFGLDRGGAAAHVQRLASHLPALAGVRAFWPDASSQEELVDRVLRLAAAGAAGFRFYQYGLCPRPNLGWVRQAHQALSKEMSTHVAR